MVSEAKFLSRGSGGKSAFRVILTVGTILSLLL